MAIYEFECEIHGRFSAPGSMDDPPKERECLSCGAMGARVFLAPQFQEDRTRFFRNPLTGTKHSYTLGHEMPDNRRDYERELASKGAEPVTRDSMPTEWKENAAYQQHVKTGGERDPSFEKARHPASKPGTVTVLGQMRDSLKTNKPFRVG